MMRRLFGLLIVVAALAIGTIAIGFGYTVLFIDPRAVCDSSELGCGYEFMDFTWPVILALAAIVGLLLGASLMRNTGP